MAAENTEVVAGHEGAAHAVRALEPFKMLLTVVLPTQA